MLAKFPCGSLHQNGDTRYPVHRRIAKNKKESTSPLALNARHVLMCDDTSSSDSNDEEDTRETRCFKCGDPNHFISDCPKNFSGDQKAFVVGSWSDSGDDSKKEEICLMAHSKRYIDDLYLVGHLLIMN
ncbi:zf-CCHC domain-containing protein [Tanacetum coccineum]